jgi:hypothetical protein
MTRIRELQNTRGRELSGIQITTYFLEMLIYGCFAYIASI